MNENNLILIVKQKCPACKNNEYMLGTISNENKNIMIIMCGTCHQMFIIDTTEKKEDEIHPAWGRGFSFN